MRSKATEEGTRTERRSERTTTATRSERRRIDEKKRGDDARDAYPYKVVIYDISV